MNDNLQFRLATPEDDARVLALFRESFQRDIPLYYWKWFSYDCPTGINRTTVIEDLEKKRFAGSYSLLPIRLSLNGFEVKASLCTNVNTHPDYRGQNLFTRIGSYALEHERDFDTPISLGMPNKNAYPGHMKVGWDVMCDLQFLVKSDNQEKHHDCVTIDRFDSGFDTFFNRIAQNYQFIVLRDHRFINWRIADRPDRVYTSYGFFQTGVLQGYVILKKFDDMGYKKAHILDFQAVTDTAFHHLVAAAECYAKDCDELNLWTNLYNPYASRFAAYGFVTKSNSDVLIVHANYGEKKAAAPGAWWFCLADNDVY
ncbi:MAG: GNAT family N-acetyltransferase [Chloroflexi bacterium]|nr:GNAT family N-acetyltransferase [Chloroflexota bacterium]